MRLRRLTVIAVLAAACGGVGDGTPTSTTAAGTTTAAPTATTATGGSQCAPLSTAEITQLVESWYGDGEFTVESTAKASTTGSEAFTEVWFLQGSAPGIDSRVFAFATDPDGLLIGADTVTREFFEWGAAATPGSPVAQEAAAALAAAPVCLP